MLEKLIKLYAAYMTFGTTGLMPHLVGPPGSGKSSVIEELAELMGVRLHIINVSRLSPLEVEGVQMPIGEGGDTYLKMLPATFWTSLEEGDIVLFDEFLRGFPEVYNALLDIFTSRRVGAYHLPKVFMVGASNSMTAYDEALEDRLLHIAVADPRKRAAEDKKLRRMLVELTGMAPEMIDKHELTSLVAQVVHPTFNVLDSMLNSKSRKVQKQSDGGRSIRNLVSQVQLRYITTNQLRIVLEANTEIAESSNKLQYLILLGDEKNIERFELGLLRLVGNKRLTPVQAKNVELNLQLIELAKARKETP